MTLIFVYMIGMAFTWKLLRKSAKVFPTPTLLCFIVSLAWPITVWIILYDY